ncbi:flavodoxin family protein [Vibrio sp. CAIM 722]|uniref:Flavodoxin family protein n=1 Tax=Vibrio eleionomae TaxID=2653505 RepID=A0A7X4RW61_9VIBR|nr:NAD(P)H-dependent oxidoreductase [Vibrio eleionomae]MZI95017.1 flavodoxin family protein [Vibrio eleionomae]
MKKALVINAHQKYDGWAEGKLNQLFSQVAIDTLSTLHYDIKTTTVDDGYDANEEVEKHLWADIVIVQTPLYWMGAPWLFKKYIDEVFNAGLGDKLAADDGRTRSDPSKTYGSGGLTTGKKLLVSVTLNAPENAFNQEEFFEGHNIDQLFMWLHKAYQFNGFESVDGFATYDIFKNPTIEQDVKRYEDHLITTFQYA